MLRIIYMIIEISTKYHLRKRTLLKRTQGSYQTTLVQTWRCSRLTMAILAVIMNAVYTGV